MYKVFWITQINERTPTIFTLMIASVQHAPGRLRIPVLYLTFG